MSSSSICQDELEYFIDLAMNESQRWLETVTRERFLDEDDFLYSIRYGTQLRKLLNKIHPGSFSLQFAEGHRRGDEASCSGEDNESEDDTACADARITYSLESADCDEESWTQSFLRICRTVLGIPPQRLFRASDLETASDDSGRDGCLPTETLDKIRRVVVTVGELGRLFETSGISGPRIDKSALEPVIRYHDHLWLIGQENDHCLSAYSSPRIKRTASTRRSAVARRKAAAKLSQVSTASGGECDASLNNENDDLDLSPDRRICGSSRISPLKEFGECATPAKSEISNVLDSNAANFPSYQATIEFCPTVSSLHSDSVDKDGSEIVNDKDQSVDVDQSLKVDSTKQMEQEDFRGQCDPTDSSFECHRISTPETVLMEQQEPRELEQYSECSLEYSRTTTPDPTVTSSMISLPTTTSVSSASLLLSVQKELNNGKFEKRTVRSMKNQTNKDQQCKLVRRPSAGIITPSAITNPLKYVQAKSDLDLRAREIIEKANEEKKKRAKMRIEEQEQEWAADLENWKLRRSSSVASVRTRISVDDDRPESVMEGNNEHSKLQDTTVTPTAYLVEKHSSGIYSPSEGPIAVDLPAPATVTTRTEGSTIRQNTSEVNGGNEPATTCRPPIVSTDTCALSGTLRNGTPSLAPAQLQQEQSNGKLTPGRLTGTTTSEEGSKKYIGSSVQENEAMKDSIPPSDKFLALKNIYDGGSNCVGDRRRLGANQMETKLSVTAPVFAKIPHAEETAIDSGVDSYRPESLTPSRDSHESLSPGSQGSGERSSTRKLSTDRVEFALRRERKTSCPNEVRTWASGQRHQDPSAKEFFVTLEQKRVKGEKGFGFTLKGGHEKGEPVAVDTVLPGSAADRSRMRVGDELLEIDGMDVARAYLTMINATISQSAKAGYVELKLRRLGNDDNDPMKMRSEVKSHCVRADQKNEEDEPSFDQKRRQFEKAASFEQQTFSPKPPLRRQCDYRRASASTVQPIATSPPPINRHDYETSSVGQLVARYATEDEPRLRSQSRDRTGSHGAEEYGTSAVPTSPFTYRRHNPGKLTDFVPDADRSATVQHIAASPTASDYRVTSVHSKSSPGNIFNFVPESEREDGNEPVTGESLVKRKNILEDRDEIDQRWRRERDRILGLTGDRKELYFRPEPTRNYALDHSPVSPTHSLRGSTSLTESHLGRNVSPPRAPPPAPPVDIDQDRSYEQSAVLAKDTIISPLSHRAQRDSSPIFSHVKHLPGKRTVLEGQSNGIKSDDHPKRPSRATDANTASRKLDDLLRKQQRQATEIELQYLEMAASAAASGVDISAHQRCQNVQGESSLRDIYQHWLVREAEDMRLNDQLRQDRTSAQGTIAKQNTTHDVNAKQGLERGDFLPNRQQQKLNDVGEEQQPVVAVHASQRCSHCTKELGRGAAMVIESLKLFFHLACFKCYVCGTVLSDGAQGADVRVRAGKLHCQRCYSSDDSGLQFSEV